MIICRPWLPLACLGLMSMVGCVRGPALAPVSGRVTLDGKPLEFGGVMFQPDAGPAALAAIGPDGRFTLRYMGKADGAVIGRNRVVVTAYECEQPGYRPKPGSEAQTGRSLVPERYASVTTTDIMIDVHPGMGDVDVALSSTP